jgi:hypothetical protein
LLLITLQLPMISRLFSIIMESNRKVCFKSGVAFPKLLSLQQEILVKVALADHPSHVDDIKYPFLDHLERVISE